MTACVKSLELDDRRTDLILNLVANSSAFLPNYLFVFIYVFIYINIWLAQCSAGAIDSK